MRRPKSIIIRVLVAQALALIGCGAFVAGFALVAMGLAFEWLAGAAALAVVALAARYLVVRNLRSALDDLTNEGVTTIYMPLINEGTDVWRPVEAIKITDLGYMVTEKAPAGEEWAFEPGHILRCEERQLSSGTQLVAVAKAT